MFRATSTIPRPFFRSARTGSNLSSRTQSSAFSRRNLILRRNSVHPGRAARSWVALTSAIRASSANLPALACMLSTSPMSSVSSPSTLHVEKTAAAPSTSNSSLASLSISTHGSKAGSLTGWGTRSSRSVNGHYGRSGRGGGSLSSASGMVSSRMGLGSYSASISSIRSSIVAMVSDWVYT